MDPGSQLFGFGLWLVLHVRLVQKSRASAVARVATIAPVARVAAVPRVAQKDKSKSEQTTTNSYKININASRGLGTDYQGNDRDRCTKIYKDTRILWNPAPPRGTETFLFIDHRLVLLIYRSCILKSALRRVSSTLPIHGEATELSWCRLWTEELRVSNFFIKSSNLLRLEAASSSPKVSMLSRLSKSK